MSFKFPNKNTPVLCQGITSAAGAMHVEKAIAYGTNIVAGVSRDKAVQFFLDIPVFQTVKEAVRKTKPQVSMIFSSPVRVYSDVEEAIKARIPLIICTTNCVPYQDTLKMRALAQKYGVCLIGPSAPGIVTVGQCTIGTIPAHLFKLGSVGIVSRSSSLTYEVVQQLDAQGLGVSACVALGSAAIIGTSFIPMVQALLSDPCTKAILIIGKTNGSFELELAEFLRKKRTKKTIAVYLPGRFSDSVEKTPVVGVKLRKAAEIVSEKQKIFERAGIPVIETVDKIGLKLAEMMIKKKGKINDAQ